MDDVEPLLAERCGLIWLPNPPRLAQPPALHSRMTESRRSVSSDDRSSVHAESLRFERLLAGISSSFIDLPIGRIDEAIDNALQRIVTTLGVDRCTLSRVNPITGQFHSNHSRAAPGFLPVPRTTSACSYPWALARHRAGLPVVFSRLTDLPAEASIDAAFYASIGLGSHVGTPVMVSGEFMAVLGIAAMRRERSWSDELVARMRLLADIFGSALARKRAQDRLDELLGFEHLLVELSTSLVGSPGMALDSTLNAALRAVATRLGADRIGLWSLAQGTGRLDLTHQSIAEGEGLPDRLGVVEFPWLVSQIIAGNVVSIPTIAAVPPGADVDALAWRAAGVKSLLVVPLHGDDAVVGAMSLASVHEERLWHDEIVPRLRLFGRMLVGALVHRNDEQAARQATAEATQVRARFAHLARVDAVSAMSTAIAHEINQPLMAIQNYAVAGRRRLANASSADWTKLDELLEKIGSQAAFASEVLDRLRAMVKRRETQETKIDLPHLIHNAVQLIETEARLKDIGVETRVAPDIPPALGDEIQVQQVILNLAHNAMEAMAAMPIRGTVMRLEATLASDGDCILIRVADRGPGIAEADKEKVFEPFHTTKESGLGIGLSISRAIVEAHGGRLWHVPNPGGGTVFQFTLPDASDCT